MFVWRKRVSTRWLAANEDSLRAASAKRLAIISKPAHKTSIAEIGAEKLRALEKIRAKFGGAITPLPRAWRKKFASADSSRLIKIGKRLVIVRSSKSTIADARRSLSIPAGAAFGTGEHATTAMSLRLLEEATRNWGNWRMLDLGTGSGILALAAKRFGAAKIVGIDLDPRAIATAKANARLNKIRDVDFRVADALKFRCAHEFQIVSANLYCDVLIRLMPRIARMLAKDGSAILSGILRTQEGAIVRAIRAAGCTKISVRRRGKWVALLCH